MSVIKPFRALRPLPGIAKPVSSVPYDVVHESEVREFIRENPQSFLHVTRPEAEFDEGDNPSDQTVFARGRENLDKFISGGMMLREAEPCLYLYRLSTGTHTQTGLVACCALDEYDNGTIKRHEKTRPDKVEDRTGHMLAVRAQTGLIFLAFRNTERVHNLMEKAVKEEPLYDFYCFDNIRQTVWRIEETEEWVEAFGEVPALYIADGHHRAESASLARKTLREQNLNHTGEEDYNYVVAGLFPAEDLKILAYNRLVKDTNGLTGNELIHKLSENFEVDESGETIPQNHGEICMYMGGRWYTLRFTKDQGNEPDPIERLDVSILQDYILAPALGIADPRTDDRIIFVGGARGVAELERAVDAGEAAVAFSMFPTTMDDLFDVSDMGEIMPPKSTWFEPKLKDGLIVHEI